MGRKHGQVKAAPGKKKPKPKLKIHSKLMKSAEWLGKWIVADRSKDNKAWISTHDPPNCAREKLSLYRGRPLETEVIVSISHL